MFESIHEYFDNDVNAEIDNLNSTDDGEPSKKSHGSSNCWQHVHKFGCSVLGDSVKGCCMKEDPHKPQLHFGIKFLNYVNIWIILIVKQDKVFLASTKCDCSPIALSALEVSLGQKDEDWELQTN